MSPPPVPPPDGYPLAPSAFTGMGLPLGPPRLSGAVPAAAVDVGDGGPTRRVACLPPTLLAAPSLLRTPPKAAPLKTPPPVLLNAGSLTLGTNDDSLMDDDEDDDELMDYFGAGGGAVLPAVVSDVVEVPGSSTPWNVRDHNVRTLPLFYPLEQSAVFVPHASAPLLASRVAAALASRSIAASYDGPNAKVDCVSRAHVEFRVRMFRGRAESSHGIIVEVQRRAGADVSYFCDAHAILDAAEGKAVEEGAGGGILPPLWYGEDKAGEDDVPVAEGGLACLQVISNILCPKLDKAGGVTVEGRDLAMASLAALTSVDRMGHSAASVSKEFLASEAHADLRRVVFAPLRQDASETPRRLRMLSLEILANVADGYRSPDQLGDILSQDDHVIMKDLFVNVENDGANPHAADLSRIVLRNI